MYALKKATNRSAHFQNCYALTPKLLPSPGKTISSSYCSPAQMRARQDNHYWWREFRLSIHGRLCGTQGRAQGKGGGVKSFTFFIYFESEPFSNSVLYKPLFLSISRAYRSGSATSIIVFTVRRHCYRDYHHSCN